METRKRSLIKAFTYRTLVTIVAFLLAYWATEDVEKSFTVVVFYLAGSMVIYYLHERLWDRIEYGRR